MDTNKKKKQKKWFRGDYVTCKDYALKSFLLNYDFKVNLEEEHLKEIKTKIKKHRCILRYPKDYATNGWIDLVTNKDLIQVIENPDNGHFYTLYGLLNAKNKMRQLQVFFEEMREIRKGKHNFFIVLSNNMGEEFFKEIKKKFRYLKENVNWIIQDNKLEVPVIFGMIFKKKRKTYQRKTYQRDPAKKYIEALPYYDREYLMNIEKLARDMMEQYGVGHFGFKFFKGRRALGLCSETEISLNVVHCIEHHIDDVKNTILHEIAHAIVGLENAHNKIWKEKAKELGVPPSRFSGPLKKRFRC